MPVDTQHPDYKSWNERWAKCRDVIAGEEEVKARGTTYLPMLSGHNQDEYDAYKTRAMFYNAADRTIRGLVGAVMGKPMKVDFPESKVKLLEDIGLKNEALRVLAKQMTQEVISVGRGGILLDAVEGDAESPYLTIYCAENITNWRTAKIEGRERLILVVLREAVEEVDTEDLFGMERKYRYRVLKLMVEQPTETQPQQLMYVQEIWAKQRDESTKQEKWVLEKLITPAKKGGATLDYIPFVFVNPTDTSPVIEKSPMEDLCDVNLSHYRTSADLEHGRHFTALPTPWFAGFDFNDPKTGQPTPIRIGSSEAIVTENPQAKAGMLEFAGAGLGHLSDALTEKEKKMAVLGARLLEEQTKGVEAAETVRLRHTGERSILANIALAVGEGLTFALYWYAEWLGFAEGTNVKVELNKDYNLLGIDPAMLEKLMAALQMGHLSWDAWFYNLERGDIYPEGWTAEEEQEKIRMGGPTPPSALGIAEEEETEEEEEETEEEEEAAA